jgi:hypothetical protein
MFTTDYGHQFAPTLSSSSMAYARRILGWRVASTMATSIVLDAIE